MVTRAKYLIFAGWLIAAGSAAGGEKPRLGLPWDWSHRHVIHNADTPEEARAKGTYDQWERSFRDARYAHAVLRKTERAQAQADTVAGKAKAAKAAPGVEAIIDHYYLTILGRAADAGGRAFHISEVERLTAASVDAREVLRVISKTFFFSPEYLAFNRSDGDYLEDLYRAYLQRPSDAAGKAYWLGQISAGLNRDALMLAFMFSEEFETFMDSTDGGSAQRPETALVMSAYRSALSRVPDSGGLASWREWLQAGQCEGTIGVKAHDFLFQFIQSPEYLARNRTSRQYVADLYDAIFRRTPDAGGFNYWAGQLDTGAMTREQVLEAFLASPEWQESLPVLASAECTSSHPVPRDWSNVLGGAGGVGLKGVFPAKYAFDASTLPSCANDFVVYPTAASGQTGAGTFGAKSGTFSGTPANNGTLVITNAGRTLTLVAGAANLNFTFLRTGGITAAATNLAAAINRNQGVVGVTASSTGGTVTVTSMTHGASAITLTDGLSNFALVGGGTTLTGGGGTAGQPTIVAFNNVYKTTCGGLTGSTPVPTVFWSYNTGVGGFVETSPVLSFDGSQVAFVERIGTNASLVLLKWSSTLSVGTTGAPTVPATAANGAAYRACAAPCMFKISLATNNTRSSPYYDYETDVIYLGAENGTLHKFTGVFLGTPAAVSGGGWPATVRAGIPLTSPVFDNAKTLVFVGSASSAGAGNGGKLHSVSATGTVVSSGELAGFVAGVPGTGVGDAVIVDQTAERVYTFVGTDTSSDCQGGASPCQAIYQFATSATINGLTTQRVQIGRGGQAARTLKTGAFDNTYWTSANPASPAGFLYACGALADLSDTDRPTLWRIPISGSAPAGTMGTPAPGPNLTNLAGPDSEECSPMTEVLRGAEDQLYVSVPNASVFACGGGGCMYRFNITSIAAGAAWTGTTPTAVLPAPGGTGGIIIDNISGLPGAAQIYYSTLTNPGNAIQASQALLN